MAERAFWGARCAGRYRHKESHKAALVGRTGHVHMVAAVGTVVADIGLAERRVVGTFERATGLDSVTAADLAVEVEGACCSQTATEDMANAKRREAG